MSRHASAEDLAALDLDALKARKAARVRSHLVSCVQCTQLNVQVSAVPTVLASASYPSMPPNLAMQLDATLVSESAGRLARTPATEAGRRDLPERKTRQARRGWQLPGLSVVATRLVAAAGALVIVGVGSYEIAANTGGSLNGSTASSTGSAVAPGASQLSLGPTVRYGQASSETVQTVSAATNFTPANLGAQAQAALHTAQLKGVKSAASVGAAAPSATGSAAKGTPSGQAAPATGLASCLNEVVGGEPVQLVETAKFEGKPATIIITEQTATRAAEVWVVGPDCSASHPDVLAHQTLSRT